LAYMIFIIIYFIVVISPLVLILLFSPITDHGIVYEMGKAFALMGFIIIAFQFVLSSRRKWLEKHFGLDMIFQYHKAMSILGGILILSHPVLLAIGSGNPELLTSFSMPWNIWLGKILILIILLQIIVSFLRTKFKIDFEKWRITHNIFGGILLIGIFIHSLVTSHADLKVGILQGLWAGIFGAGIIAYIHHKFIKPAKLKNKAYSISNIKQETHNVWTLEMTPSENQRIYDYKPGQFHFIKILDNKDLQVEEHHFTISSSPTRQDFVSSSIKESGDFTSKISNVKKGDLVSVEAPFGRFSHVFHPEDSNFVFIVGGIGITPIMSMLRYMHAKKSENKALLMYANHSQKDIVFQDELETIAGSGYPDLKVIHVLDRPEKDWNGEVGYINGKIISNYVTDFNSRAFYVCCPPKMRKKVLQILSARGVNENQIRVEIFSL